MTETEYREVTSGEMCPYCDNVTDTTLDYQEVVRLLKGEEANLPLDHCGNCGRRLLPCGLCEDAINDGYITEDDRDCYKCKIHNHWNTKFGIEKEKNHD